MTPPADDEFELSLFGPGIGECAVLHVGAGDWVVVDSCLNAAGDKAIALEYLEQLGVDVGTQLKLVVVTHWHDDHIKGMAQLLRFAPSARFACSAALRCEEFLQLVYAGKAIKLVDNTSGVSEFGQVFGILDEHLGGRFCAGPDHWTCGDMLLYSRTGTYDVSIHALSPSAQTITDTKGQLAEMLPRPSDPIRRFHATGPNDHSVVLLAAAGSVGLLLGADLETGSDARRGWRAIVESATRPQLMGSVYKVAHHGSPNADHGGIWDTMLATSPLLVLTPYARGERPLPSMEDVQRLKARASEIYCTAWPTTRSSPKRHNAVDRTMREVTRTRRAIRRTPGHIRLRLPLNDPTGHFSVELFNNARAI